MLIWHDSHDKTVKFKSKHRKLYMFVNLGSRDMGMYVCMMLGYKLDSCSSINKKFWKNYLPTFLLHDTGCTENDTSNSSFTVACVRIAVVMFLTSGCLAKIRGYRPMGGVHEVCHWKQTRCHDIHEKVHKDWFRVIQKLTGGTHTAW